MNKKILKGLTGFLILLILILSGCTSENTTVSYPLFPDVEQTSYKNETIWDIMNVSSNLNKTLYVTNSEISNIVSWYENKENIDEYEILDGGSSGIYLTNIDPNNVTYGYAKIHKENKTEGLFVFIIKALEEMQLEKEKLMGIAEGPWDLIKNCEKTRNFTSSK